MPAIIFFDRLRPTAKLLCCILATVLVGASGTRVVRKHEKFLVRPVLTKYETSDQEFVSRISVSFIASSFHAVSFYFVD